MSMVMSIIVEGVTRKLSAEGVAGATYYYEPYVISSPSLSLAYGDSGGYIKPRYGNVVFSPDLFTAKPADTLAGTIYWLDSETLAATVLFTGTFVLQSIGRDEVVYSIREHEFAANMLSLGVDESGDPVDIPIAMGTISTAAWRPFFPAQRSTNGVAATFYKGGGFFSTGLKVFDDYNDVTAACDDSSGDAYGVLGYDRSTSPATVYIVPAAQAISTLAHLADFVATKLGVTASYPAAFSTYPLVKFVKTNRKAIDFLDKACGFYGQVFTLSGDLTTLTFYNRATADTSPITITSFDFFEAPIGGKRLIRNLSTRSENARLPEQDPLDLSWHLSEKSWYAKVVGDAYGDDIEVETFLDYRTKNYFRNTNVARLTSLLALWQKAWATVTMPIDGNLYDIGRDLIIYDDTFSAPLSTTMKILNIDYNFDQETVTYKGPATTV